MKQTITADSVIKMLNDANRLDPKAVSSLFLRRRVTCNRWLAEHEHIQVRTRRGGSPPYKVGVLGIINGMFGTDARGFGPIAMCIDKGKILRFQRTKK